MGRWSRSLADEVVTRLAPRPGLRWLDVGCGTGAASEAVMVRATPSSLIGVDPSAAFVAAAASRLDDQRATFVTGDAMDLPVPDSSVDRVICGLALNFVPDPVGAGREMSRALVAEGLATAYVWDYSDEMQMLRYFWDAAVAEDPQAISQDEGATFPLCRPESLHRCFVDSGFAEVKVRAVDLPTVFRDFDDYWVPFLGGQGHAPRYCAALPDGAKERLRGRLLAALPREPDGSISLWARAWEVTGVSG